MEAGTSDEEIFENPLDMVEDEMEVDNQMEGISNLFSDTNAAGDNERSKTNNETDMEPFCGFSDDLFTESEEPAKKIGPSTNAKHKSDHSKVKYESDSDSDSDTGFGLFDDTDDDNDVAYLFRNINVSPGCLLSKVHNERSHDTETKTKVDEGSKMFPVNTTLNHVNKRIMGLSLSQSDTKLSTEEYTGPKPEDDNFCSICRDAHTNPKTLRKCSHSFCTDCIDEYFKIKPACPECFVAYGVITGSQPEGYMSDSISKIKLPGYEAYNTIVISYSFSDGTQTSEHPNPGQQYYGTSRTAYLPNCPEGQKVLKLLKEAFKRRLTFTVGRSRTTGCDNVVTWNDVHHKTCTSGGQQNFGYPDPTYLQRVQEELAALGVTEESMKENACS